MENTRVQEIIEMIKNKVEDDSILQELVAQCNSWDGSLEEYYYWANDEDFYDTMFSTKDDVARAVWASGDDYNYTDDYVRLNVYGNLESCNLYTLLDMLHNNKDEIIETYIEIFITEKSSGLDYEYGFNSNEEINKLFEELSTIQIENEESE